MHSEALKTTIFDCKPIIMFNHCRAPFSLLQDVSGFSELSGTAISAAVVWVSVRGVNSLREHMVLLIRRGARTDTFFFRQVAFGIAKNSHRIALQESINHLNSTQAISIAIVTPHFKSGDSGESSMIAEGRVLCLRRGLLLSVACVSSSIKSSRWEKAWLGIGHNGPAIAMHKSACFESLYVAIHPVAQLCSLYRAKLPSS